VRNSMTIRIMERKRSWQGDDERADAEHALVVAGHTQQEPQYEEDGKDEEAHQTDKPQQSRSTRPQSRPASPKPAWLPQRLATSDYRDLVDQAEPFDQEWMEEAGVEMAAQTELLARAGLVQPTEVVERPGDAPRSKGGEIEASRVPAHGHRSTR
jgi:hypothetical protein